MPAASNKTESKPSTEAVDPVKQFLNLVDKKVRNIEKRKVNCILLSSEFRIIWPWLPGETKIPITFSDWSRGCMMYIFTYAILMEPERYFFVFRGLLCCFSVGVCYTEFVSYFVAFGIGLDLKIQNGGYHKHGQRNRTWFVISFSFFLLTLQSGSSHHCGIFWVIA